MQNSSVQIMPNNYPGAPWCFPAVTPSMRYCTCSGSISGLLATATLLLGLLSSSQLALAQTQAQLTTLIFDAQPFPVAGEPQAIGDTAVQDQVPLAAGSDLNDEQLAELQENIKRYKASIQTLARTESPYADALREQKFALALLYQQQGDHEAAITSLEDALHIDRVNHGLFTSSQLEIVETLMISQGALGQYNEVADYKEYLYYIQRKNYQDQDPRLLAAMESWADWNVEYYLKDGPRYSASDTISLNSSTSAFTSPAFIPVSDPVTGRVSYLPRNSFSSFMNPASARANTQMNDFAQRSAMASITLDDIVDQRLLEAKAVYEELLEDEGNAVPLQQQIVLQHKLANITYAAQQVIEDLNRPSSNSSLYYNRINANPPAALNREFAYSRDALQDLIVTLEADPQTPALATAQAYLNLGDWNLSFNRNRNALAAYAKAWELLHPNGADAAELAPTPSISLDPILNPNFIVPVPGFAIHPYSRAYYGMEPDTRLQYKGYIDATLSIDKLGKVRKLDITDTSENTSQLLRSALLDFLRDNRMRPKIFNGETVAVEDLNLRFYYYY